VVTKFPNPAEENISLPPEYEVTKRNLTPEFMSLLSGMMERDHGKRFTAEQVLRHPWFANSREPTTFMDNESIVPNLMLDALALPVYKTPSGSASRLAVPPSVEPPLPVKAVPLPMPTKMFTSGEVNAGISALQRLLEKKRQAAAGATTPQPPLKPEITMTQGSDGLSKMPSDKIPLAKKEQLTPKLLKPPVQPSWHPAQGLPSMKTGDSGEVVIPSPSQPGSGGLSGIIVSSH